MTYSWLTPGSVLGASIRVATTASIVLSNQYLLRPMRSGGGNSPFAMWLSSVFLVMRNFHRRSSVVSKFAMLVSLSMVGITYSEWHLYVTMRNWQY